MLLTWQVWESCDGSGRGFCWERSSPATTPSATASSGKNRDDSFRVEWTQWFYYGGFQLRWWWWWWWWWWWFCCCGCGDGGGRINWLETSERFGKYGTWKHGILWKMIEKYEPMMKLEPLSKTKTGRQTRFYWTEWPIFSLTLWFMFCAGNYGSHQSGTSWCTILTSGWVK